MVSKLKIPNWIPQEDAELLSEAFDIVHAHTGNMIVAAEAIGITEKAFVAMFSAYVLSYARMAFQNDEKGMDLLRDLLNGTVNPFEFDSDTEVKH